jgi:hypothetical protein
MIDLFGNTTPTQSPLNFPVALTERYRPRTVDAFVGLDKPKRICNALASRPFESAWLFIGPSGTGKTTMAMALAEQIPAEIHHIPCVSARSNSPATASPPPPPISCAGSGKLDSRSQPLTSFAAPFLR